MWKRKLNRRWLCAVMAVVLLAILTGFSGENAVMAKTSHDAEEADTVSGNQTLADSEEEKEPFTDTKGDENKKVGTASGNGIPSDMEAEEYAEEMEASAEKAEMPVLPNVLENANITFPSQLEVAFNPLGIAIGTGDGGYSTAQVVSSDYEIINKGSVDAVVTVAIQVEDLNGGEIIFADSPEEVEAAGKNAYAIYLSVVSAEKEDGIGSDVRTAVPIYEGENQVSFRLPAGGGRAAFTFDGVMNSEAEWWELSRGIRISTIYSCEAAKEAGVAISGAGTSAMAE